MTDTIVSRDHAIVFGALLLTACTAPVDNLQRVGEYQDRKNAGDLDAVMEMFTHDAELHFGALGTLQGSDQIRAIHEYDVALATVLSFESCAESGSDVSCTTIESNEWLRLAGIENVTYAESRFSFNGDGRIQTVSATLTPESAAALGQALANFDGWARANRAGEYSALFTDTGKFVYSGDNGKKVLGLLRDWQTSAATE